MASPEVPEFVPTRHALLALAKYWVDVYFYWATFMWEHQTYCRPGFLQESYALGQVDRIADVVGPEVIHVVVQPVVEAYRSQLGDNFWHRFMNSQNPPEEWLDGLHREPGPDAAQHSNPFVRANRATTGAGRP